MLDLIYLQFHAAAHRVEDNLSSLGTSFLGAVVAHASAEAAVKWLGVVGIVAGIAGVVSREARGWRQQWVAERTPKP